MDAHAVDRAAEQLRELRHQEWEDAAVAAAAFGLAIAAVPFSPALALALLAGGLALAGLAIRALFRRWDLVEALLLSRDAYAIPEVRSRAERSATLNRRRSLAVSIRVMLAEPWPSLADRIAAVREELDGLADELDDPELTLDPLCAVLCERLLGDPEASALLNSRLPPEDVRSRVRTIRAGFERQPVAGETPHDGPAAPHPAAS